MQNAIIPPRTVMEVFDLLPEGTRAEVIENNLVMSPAPTFNHQNIVGKIFFKIFLYLRDHPIGEVVIAPIDVYLDEKNVVQPDVVFVLEDRRPIIQNDGLHGSPDLVVEVLSPGTRGNDFLAKRELYQRSGVKEYWIVDPDTKHSFGYTRVGNELVEFSRSTGSISSVVLGIQIEF